MNEIYYLSDEEEYENKSVPNKDTTDALKQAIKLRFPNATFKIDCFKDKSEIETSILTQKKMILFQVFSGVEEGPKLTCFNDTFLIRKKPECNSIRVCDIIDQLILYGFHRHNCSEQTMGRVREVNHRLMSKFKANRFRNSLTTYESTWF